MSKAHRNNTDINKIDYSDTDPFLSGSDGKDISEKQFTENRITLIQWFSHGWNDTSADGENASSGDVTDGEQAVVSDEWLHPYG